MQNAGKSASRRKMLDADLDLPKKKKSKRVVVKKEE